MKVIYLKLTNACNLRCKHCYNEQMNNHYKMSPEIIHKSIQYIHQLRQENPSEDILIQFHGGEPMLVKPSVIQNIINQTKDDNVMYGITTNLTYELTDDKLAILKQMSPLKGNRPFIQTSWDEYIRFNNEKQEQLWLNNVRLCTEYDIDVQVTICLTIDLFQSYSPKQFLDKVLSWPTRYINFERITENGAARLNNIRPLNNDVDVWLTEFYKLCENTDLQVALFDSVKLSIQGKLTGCRARRCTHDVRTINPDGSLATCPNTAHQPIAYSLDEKSSEEKMVQWHMKEGNTSLECFCCALFKYCNRECFQLRWDESGCPGLNRLYLYLLSK